MICRKFGLYNGYDDCPKINPEKDLLNVKRDPQKIRLFFNILKFHINALFVRQNGLYIGLLIYRMENLSDKNAEFVL